MPPLTRPEIAGRSRLSDRQPQTAMLSRTRADRDNRLMDDELQTWRPRSPQIELATLHKVLLRHPLVVVHFWAVWNLYDRKMDEVFEWLKPRYVGRVEFRSLDVDIADSPEFCRDCRVLNLPAVAAFVRGDWVDTLIGLRSRDELDERLRGWMTPAETRHPMWDQDVDAAMRFSLGIA